MRRRILLAGMLLVVAIPAASLPVGTVDFIDVDDCAGRVAIEPRECEEAVVAPFRWRVRHATPPFAVMVLVDGELFEEFVVENFLEADPVRRSHNWVGFSGVEALQGEQHHVALRLANPATGQWLGIDSPVYRLHLDANSNAQVAYHQMLRAAERRAASDGIDPDYRKHPTASGSPEASGAMQASAGAEAAADGAGWRGGAQARDNHSPADSGAREGGSVEHDDDAALIDRSSHGQYACELSGGKSGSSYAHSYLPPPHCDDGPLAAEDNACLRSLREDLHATQHVDCLQGSAQSDAPVRRLVSARIPPWGFANSLHNMVLQFQLARRQGLSLTWQGEFLYSPCDSQGVECAFCDRAACPFKAVTSCSSSPGKELPSLTEAAAGTYEDAWEPDSYFGDCFRGEHSLLRYVSALTGFLFQPNLLIRQHASDLREAIRLPDRYLGVHVRHGDACIGDGANEESTQQRGCFGMPAFAEVALSHAHW